MDEKKRKHVVNKKVYLFTNDRTGLKRAGLFEFKISITEWGDGKYVVDSNYSPGQTLEAIKTFYDQIRPIPAITSVAACVLGPDLLYLIPHDEDSVLPSDISPFMSGYTQDLVTEQHERLAPCLFHLSQKTNLRIESPLARKNEPNLIFIGNKVFALSSPCPSVRCPEPCFESLVVFPHNDHVTFKQWTPLNCPPFHVQNSSITSLEGNFFVMGIVVLEEEGLILVSVADEINTASYFSYNIRSEKWSPVHINQVDYTSNDKGFPIPLYLHENVVVVDNNIYTYYSKCRRLLVLPYTYTGACDLSLDSVCEVQGFKYEQNIEHISNHHPTFYRSGTVAKVEDHILCVIHTLCPIDYDVQQLCITFIQLVGDGKECTTLNSFTCTLSNGTEFDQQSIKSCFVLDEEKADHHGGKRAVLSNNSDDGVSSRRDPENTF